MRTWTLGAVAVACFAVLAAGCGSDDVAGQPQPSQGQSDTAVSGAYGTELIGATGPQWSGGSGTLPGITVVGSGTAKAVPNVADWSFTVRSDADTASGALEAAAEGTKKLVAALKGAGIADEDLQTEQISLYPRTTDDARAVIGYTASSSVHATVRDLDKAGKVVDAAVRAGANEFYGPQLRVSDSRAQYRDAVSAALDDARAHAEALAAKAGVTLGAPVAIVENGGGPPVPVYDRYAAADAAVAIEPGVNEISATLTVTFAIS
jgi:uncharacterized protein